MGLSIQELPKLLYYRNRSIFTSRGQKNCGIKPFWNGKNGCWGGQGRGKGDILQALRKMADLPNTRGENDCPVCLGENLLEGREAVCPNGHRICAECQPHVQSVRNWRTGHASCPLCRAAIPHIPADLPALTEEQRRAFTEEHRRLMREQQELRRAHPQPVADTEARRERAIRGFRENGHVRRANRERFLQLREQGRIPANSMFGGVHSRCCGTRNCNRRGGDEGVRFLKIGTKRMYRCEVCYTALTGDTPPPVPNFVEGLMNI